MSAIALGGKARIFGSVIGVRVKTLTPITQLEYMPGNTTDPVSIRMRIHR